MTSKIGCNPTEPQQYLLLMVGNKFKNIRQFAVTTNGGCR